MTHELLSPSGDPRVLAAQSPVLPSLSAPVRADGAERPVSLAAHPAPVAPTPLRGWSPTAWRMRFQERRA